jgi:TatD DNase family protein
MIELADSHAHLDMPEFDPDRAEVVSRAWQAGVRFILCPADAASPASVARSLELNSSFPWIAAAAGVHPHQAKDLSQAHLDALRDLANEQKIRALGEIGLDYHYAFSPPERQREAFRVQLELAQGLGLPVVIHSRQAGPDVVAAVAETRFTRGGVLHCFTEDWEVARQMLERGFFISFSGILTYPSAGGIRDTAARVPADRLLVETDAPFLVPAPRRGKTARNEPAFVVETARRLASLRKTSLEELGELTLSNFRTLFSLSESSG